MATSLTEKVKDIKDMSGGVQRTTSKFLRQANEQELGINTDYKRVGGIGKILGYTQLGNTITTSTTTSTTSSTTTSTSTSTSSSTSSSTSTSSTTTP
jgi:hypothetical protein